jgi:glycosyltransferase involved in cell wall biosynthesis
LLEHERTAWLVTPNSPKALADGLAHLLTHPQRAQALGEQARREVAHRFSRADFDGQLRACLDEVAGTA